MRRRRAFPGYGPEIDAKYERASAWLRAAIFGNQKAADWCKANGIKIEKQSGETINSAGAALVPPDLSKAILDLRDSYGAFRATARPIPMASDSTSVPRRPGGTGAFFMAENSTAQDTQANVDLVNLTAQKIGALLRISNELEEDAAPDMVDFIANEIAYAFAALEDDCAFNGDGTSAYGKMRGIGTIVLDGQHNQAKVTAATGHNTFLTLDNTDLANLMAQVQAAAIPNAAWFCSQTAYAQTFCRLTAANGNQMDMLEVNGIVRPHYLGFPVVLTQKLPLISTTLSGKVMMAFGDMYLGAVLGERRGVTVTTSPDRFMREDQIAVLGTERFHTVIHDIGDNTNTGALAALVGGS